MNKTTVKQVLGVAVISLAVVIVYDIAKSKYNASKTSAPATTVKAA